MHVYVVTDMEGISGITGWNQVAIDYEGALYQESRRLLTAEVNACVAGCLDGGATAVTVMDGHGGGFNFIPEELHPAATYITGVGRPNVYAGLDSSVACGILLGFHAMNGVQDAVLHHTQSHIGELKYWYNDVECGEIAQSSLVLGHFDVPVVMATGCNRACEEARRFLGEEIVTVEVKEGLSRTSCRMIAPPAARELIHAGAAEAMGRVTQCRPLKYDLPIRGRLRLENKETVDQYAANGNSRRVDDLTLEREFASALEIYYF